MMDAAKFLVGQKVTLVGHFARPVYIQAVEQKGNTLALQVRLDDGSLQETRLTTQEIDEILKQRVTDQQKSQQFASAEDLRLFVESHRIDLAYAYDPLFAVSLSGIRSLPHQIEAVYGHMLPQARLRFLLADDPGAGKTIMTGLLIKELKLRNALERILIIVPAALTIQWQDELLRFFNEVFIIVDAEKDKQQLVNHWQRESQILVSMDYAKQEGVREKIWAAGWDLVVVDEAHKCSAYTKTRTGRSAEAQKTKRYQLVEYFSSLPSSLLLLLTATPHQGNEDRFAHFLHLLDPDIFPEPHKMDSAGREVRQSMLGLGKDSPWILRRLKEDLRDFNGRRIFPDRHSRTVTFILSPSEYRLYDLVNRYLNRFLTGGTGAKKQSIALTRTVFQRRLASSTFAIFRSLERRFNRLNDIIQELETLSPEQQRRRLLHLAGVVDEERDEDDLDERERDELVSEVTAAEQLNQLQEELETLHDLVGEARQIYNNAPDNKLSALRDVLARAELTELKGSQGRLLIFTEHRDTMEYLSGHLRKWGFQVCHIHGGMNPHDRRHAQDIFRTEAQICVATEAAGEGINLQFCHLMINYDLPWNPARLEQRMGRIHRIGQDKDVYAFNFVADQSSDGKPVIEGRILRRLLEKLEQMRTALGSDRVYDVIGQVLALNQINLSDMLRDAALYPGRLSEYEDKIEQITLEKLTQYEEQTGIALARAYVDFPWAQDRSFNADECRLMPEYVQRQFLSTADKVGLKVETRADGLLRIPHVPQDLRSETLAAVRRFAKAESRYSKITFRKEDLEQDNHSDAWLISPGHPLYAAVDEKFRLRYGALQGSYSLLVDSDAQAPYFLHFFEADIAGDYPRANSVLHSELVCVRQQGEQLELTAPDILHDLAPLETVQQQPQIDWRSAEEYVRNQFQLDRRRWKLEERKQQAQIISSYLEKSYTERIWAAQQRAMALRSRYDAGEKEVALAAQEAEREIEYLERRRADCLSRLRDIEVVRPGPVRYLASFYIVPARQVEQLGTLLEDPVAKAASEFAAMKVVMDHERARGWEPVDVSLQKVGFDIRSLSPADPQTGRRDIRRIEVKGRQRGAPVRLTENEWRKARQLGDSYWLYVVWDPQSAGWELMRVCNPGDVLGPYIRPISQISHWEIGAEAIIRVSYMEDNHG
jgi:SNF2 family DNA or RNA helicase